MFNEVEESGRQYVHSTALVKGQLVAPQTRIAKNICKIYNGAALISLENESNENIGDQNKLKTYNNII